MQGGLDDRLDGHKTIITEELHSRCASVFVFPSYLLKKLSVNGDDPVAEHHPPKHDRHLHIDAFLRTSARYLGVPLPEPRRKYVPVDLTAAFLLPTPTTGATRPLRRELKSPCEPRIS